MVSIPKHYPSKTRCLTALQAKLEAAAAEHIEGKKQ